MKIDKLLAAHYGFTEEELDFTSTTTLNIVWVMN